MLLARHRLIITVFSFFTFLFCRAQTFTNPSFEGPPESSKSPSPWYPCNEYSTPDTQPGSWSVTKPAANGSTYISLTTRGINGDINDNTVEAIGVSMTGTFSPHSCYQISLDLAFSSEFYFNGISYLPVLLKVYASRSGCDKTALVWTSPLISNSDWETYKFTFTPDQSYSDLILEAAFAASKPYPGNILIDNLVLEHTDLDLEKEFLLCGIDKIHIDAGLPNATVLWSDGSEQTTIDVMNGGVYWVEVHQDNCILRDTIQVYRCCELSAPNVFTPNDDSWNNRFEITSGSDIGRYDLKIYNRWGKLVFTSNDISQSWDGRDGSNEVPSGVYYWYVTMLCIDNNKILDNTYKGTVSVMR